MFQIDVTVLLKLLLNILIFNALKISQNHNKLRPEQYIFPFYFKLVTIWSYSN
jgi:hypothetical protein